MNAVRMTSSPSGTSAGEGTKAHLVRPAAALSAPTSVRSAESRSGRPRDFEFSISSNETTSALSVLIADTILACCRARLAASAAPRGPLPEQVLAVIGLPSRSLYVVQLPPEATQSAAVVAK